MLQNGTIFCISAAEITDLAILQQPDAFSKLLDKVAVVGNEQQHTLKLLDGSFHPFSGCDIQMVRRFVQNQKVDFLIHQHTQSQTALLAAGEVSDSFEYILTLEQKLSQPVTGHLWCAILFIEHGIVQGTLRVGKMDDLRQISPFDGRAKLDLTLAILITQQALDKGGFTGAVITQQSDPVAALHIQLHIRK